MRLTQNDDTPAGEASELEYGVLLGLAPQPEVDRVGDDGVAVTRPSSDWNHRRCHRCGQTFRRGDRVRVSDRGRTVVHLAPGLGCAGPADADSAREEVGAFRAGLLAEWPAGAGLRLRQLDATDWRIPRGPGDLRDSHVCLQCGHTFRPGEYVVVCPCRPTQPPNPDGSPREAACGRAVHRDPAAGLSCWESWRPDGQVKVCPVTQVNVGGT
jgi:hypothetical protein